MVALERILFYLQNVNTTIIYDECYHFKNARRECDFDYFVKEWPECLTSVVSSSNEIISFKRLNGIEEMLQHLTTIGPLIGYVKAPSLFESYKKGIVWKKFCGNSNSTEEQTNFGHFISIIGFGIDNETKKDYWLIKLIVLAQIGALTEVMEKLSAEKTLALMSFYHMVCLIKFVVYLFSFV